MSTPPSIAELVQRYKRMVLAGSGVAPMASANLDYWLSKQGGTRKIAASRFQNDGAVTGHLEQVHRDIFLSLSDKTKGIVPRIRNNPKPATYSMTWEDSTYASPLTDLYFGLGGFTLRSEVEVEVAPAKSKTRYWDVTFIEWKAQAMDDYNWDHGKSVYIPFWGKIDDADAIRVERAGLAKSFLIESIPWRVTDEAIVGPTQIKI